jgi:hypothetical protein
MSITFSPEIFNPLLSFTTNHNTKEAGGKGHI